MNPAPAIAPVEKAPPRRPPQEIPQRIRRPFFAVFKYAAGAAFCFNLLTSLLVIGWSFRAAQRIAIRQWWRSSRQRAAGVSFETFAAGSGLTLEHRQWPNWILAQGFWRNFHLVSGFRGLGNALLGSLFRNFRIGAQGLFTTWTLTLPAGALMLFGWYDGWNNSFAKGYEQYAIGMGISWAGILWFIAAMFYVPMAQMRQAVTGDWKSFYQFRLVWKLIRRRWLSSVGLAILHSLLMIPLSVAIAYPMFFAMNGRYAAMNASEAHAMTQGYYWYWSFYCFGAYVALRWVAARVYAGAVLSAVQRGALTEDQLSKVEWETLHRLELLQVQPRPVLHPVLRLVAWAGTKAGRFACGVALFFAWFSLIAQLYIGQFVNYHPRQSWLNQPLIQLPWSDYTP